MVSVRVSVRSFLRLRRISSECLADRSRNFFARRWRRRRALYLLAGFCPSGLGCRLHRSRYFFARCWRRRRALNLLAGRFCPSGLGCRLVYQAMRAFRHATISEEHANCIGKIILWCHCSSPSSRRWRPSPHDQGMTKQFVCLMEY